MGRFYETVFYDSSIGVGLMGWQLLASPPEINGKSIPYEDLLAELGAITTVDELGGLDAAFALVGDPTRQGSWVQSRATTRSAGLRKASRAQMEALLTAPVFAAETSPLGATSVSKLASLATTAGVAVINEHAALIFVGTRLGLVVIRGLDAVSGAVWDGARPEIVEFSGDVTASLLLALRHRLGVRTQTGTKKKPR
jgi:hypothetical protein